jgi:DNA-binding NarL/FixJ family response regulator
MTALVDEDAQIPSLAARSEGTVVGDPDLYTGSDAPVLVLSTRRGTLLTSANRLVPFPRIVISSRNALDRAIMFHRTPASVIIDMTADWDGLDEARRYALIRRVRLTIPFTPLLVITEHPTGDQEHAVGLAAAGASTVLNQHGLDLMHAERTVLRWASQTWQISNGTLTPTDTNRYGLQAGAHMRLSPRHQQILFGLSLDMSKGAIGEVLGLSEDTIKTHVLRMRAAAHARNVNHLLHLAYEPDPTAPPLPLPDDAPVLGRRALQCLSHLAHGDTYAEAGVALGIETLTVKSHIAKVRKNLGKGNPIVLAHLWGYPLNEMYTRGRIAA